MSLDITKLWFSRAVPQPQDKNVQVQLGCHFEEVAEQLEQLVGTDATSETHRKVVAQALRLFSNSLKKGGVKLAIADRKEFLDAIADQIVTGVGCGYMVGMDVPEALNRVNASNFSKFDENGFPIFDEDGKIAKNPATYHKVDLTGLY